MSKTPNKSSRRRSSLKNNLVKSLNSATKNYVACSILDTYKDFCNKTSLHGFRFVNDEIEEHEGFSCYLKRTCRVVSCFLWLVCIILGTIFAFYLMMLIYRRYIITPTITTIETNNYPIWHVPFPGVTICNVNSVYKPNTRNLSSELQRRGFSQRSIDMYFQSLSALVNFQEVDREFLSIWQALEDMGYTTEKIMFEVAQPCSKLLKYCLWLGREMPCRNLFRVAKSAGGFCCSFNYKALRSQYEMQNNGISPDISGTFFESLAALVNFEEVDSEFLKTFEILESYGYSAERMMFELAQPCENLLKNCSWLGKSVSCGTLFRIAKSSFGFCCSFNYKALRSVLEIETKADDYYQINTPVIRISGAGEDVGLRVLLDVEPEEYVAAKRLFYGAEIIIHDPEDFPEKSLLTAFGQPGFEVSMAVMPSVVVTEPNAESLPVNLRFCKFSYEKKLRITKKYSFQSCITECRAYMILRKCECLPFFYPTLYYHNDSSQYRQCTLKDVKCLSDNKHVFASLEPPLDVTEEMYNILNTTNIGMTCDCLPSCSEQIYNVQTFISQRFDDINNPAVHFNVSDISNYTLIKVYFKDFSCIKYRREIFMTWDDLLASFGGIFGLCLGGSVLSLVEIIYFITFKFYAKLLHNKADIVKRVQNQEKPNNFIHNFPNHINFNRTRFIPVAQRYKQQKGFLW